jgi:hypothetical protein
MNDLDIDDGLAGVLALAREKYAPVQRALAEHAPLKAMDLASLAGAVGALLDAIDARTPEMQATKAVA